MSSSETDARAARAAFDRQLGTDPDAVAPSLPPGFGDAAERFVALLLEANERTNLTRVVEPEAVARLHLLDSVSALPVLDELRPGRALDLGSGGGVPGILLALARPSVRWTLLDSVGRKAGALRGFVDALGLASVDVIADRAEILGRDPAQRAAYDAVTARACAPLGVLVEYALPFLRVGGSLLAWKGPIADDELHAGAAAAEALGGGRPDVRTSGFAALGDHRFVVIRKEAPTPARYPRRPGEASRRPLGA